MDETYQANNVAIAISSFKSTQSVATLLDKIFSSDISFSEIIVVDSLSDGSMEKLLTEKNYKVTFFNSTTNLGSAGNLNKRLEIASQNSQNEWCFCINHDGYFDTKEILHLISSIPTIQDKSTNIGAIFPNRINYNKNEQPDFKAYDTYSKTLWASSDGCLYSLQPYRQGCKVNQDLWMGWEDLIYCLELKEKGYQCYTATNGLYFDGYEYQKITLLCFTLYIADKPSWYNYYSIRNLVLGLRYLESKDYMLKFTAKTFIKSVITTALFKNNKKERLIFSIKGLIDGLIGKTGQEAGLNK